jgi:hypothetical protein
MMAGMSDDELRNYAKMAGKTSKFIKISGMGNIDPSLLRQSANMAKNMNGSQFDDMKKQVSWLKFNNF